MKELTVQDWCEIIVAFVAIAGAIWGTIKFFYKKYSVKGANMRVNFFKSNKTWTLRVYNSSSDDIEAEDIEVVFPDYEGIITDWKCDQDKFPSLKKQGHFDIRIMLCTSAPDTLSVKLIWRQGKKKFSTTETVQLR